MYILLVFFCVPRFITFFFFSFFRLTSDFFIYTYIIFFFFWVVWCVSPTRNGSHLHLSGTSRPKHETFFRCSRAHSWMHIHGMKSTRIYESKLYRLCTRPDRLTQRTSSDLSITQSWCIARTMINNIPTHSFPQATGTEVTIEETARSLKIEDSNKDILSDYWGSARDLFSLNMGGPRQSVSSLGGLGLDLSTTHITR